MSIYIQIVYACLCRGIVYDIFCSEMIFRKDRINTCHSNSSDDEAETDDENHPASSNRSKLFPLLTPLNRQNVDPGPKTQYLRRCSAGRIMTPRKKK